MPKTGVFSVAAHNHPHIGKKPLQRNASLWLYLLLIVSLVFVSACVSERGRPGPAGANGTPGATGPAGAGNMTAGPAGPPGPAPDLTDYYLNDTSKALTGQNLFRNVNTENLNLFGGTTTAGKGGIVSVQGKDLAANDAIVFYVPDMTYVANLIAAKFIGGVGQPYLDMQTRQIKSLGDPTANQDAATKKYVDDINATSVTDHGALTGLADDDHLQYANLSGRAGGQTINGGTGNNEDLTLNATANGGGYVLINPIPKGGSVGAVGIGTTNPIDQLELKNTNIVDDSRSSFRLGNGNSWIRMFVTGTNHSSNIGMFDMDAGTRDNITTITSFSDKPFYFGTYREQPLKIGTNNLIRMTINESGNVGVNTTNPLRTFQVGNTLYVDNTTGNVGIGISDPNRALTVGGIQGWNKSNVERAYLSPESTGADFVLKDSVGVTKIRFDSRGAAAVSFIDRGNFGIATQSPTELLDVNGDTIRLRNPQTITSSTTACSQGEISWNASFIFVCTATNTWMRAGLSTW